MKTLLTIPEELFLLTVHEKTGRKTAIKSRKFDLLLVSSILMELALERKIDTDLNHLYPDQPDLTGHPLLDTALTIICKDSIRESIDFWLLRLTENASLLRRQLVEELISKGLVRVEKERVFLGFSTRTYPAQHGSSEITEVKTRVREMVFSSDLPNLREMVLLSLLYYGDLLTLLFSEEEIRLHNSRIRQLAKMDLIGQTIHEGLRKLSFSLVTTLSAKEFLGMKTPEEKLEELVEEMKIVMHISRDEDLPDWLRKGTAQYLKTLQYITETGTREIVYNPKTDAYGLKIWAFPGG